MRKCFFLKCQPLDEVAVRTLLARWRAVAGMDRCLETTAAVRVLLEETIYAISKDDEKTIRGSDDRLHDKCHGAVATPATATVGTSEITRASAKATQHDSATASADASRHRAALSQALLGDGEMSALLWKTLRSHSVPWRVSLRLAQAQLAALPERQRRAVAARGKQRPYSFSRYVLQAWDSAFVDKDRGMNEVYTLLRRCTTVVQFAQAVSSALRTRPELNNVLPVPHSVLEHCYTISCMPSAHACNDQTGAKSNDIHQCEQSRRTAIRSSISSVSGPGSETNDRNADAAGSVPASWHAGARKQDTASVDVALRVCRHLSLLGRDVMPRHVRERLTMQYARLYGRAGNWKRAMDIVRHDRCTRLTSKILFADYARQHLLHQASPFSSSPSHQLASTTLLHQTHKQPHSSLPVGSPSRAQARSGEQSCGSPAPVTSRECSSAAACKMTRTAHDLPACRLPTCDTQQREQWCVPAAELAHTITHAPSWSSALATLEQHTFVSPLMRCDSSAWLCTSDAAYLAFLARSDHPATFTWQERLDMYGRVRPQAQSYRTLRPLIEEVPLSAVDYVIRIRAALVPVAARMYAGTLTRRLHHITRCGAWALALALGCASAHYDMVLPLLYHVHTQPHLSFSQRQAFPAQQHQRQRCEDDENMTTKEPHCSTAHRPRQPMISSTPCRRCGTGCSDAYIKACNTDSVTGESEYERTRGEGMTAYRIPDDLLLFHATAQKLRGNCVTAGRAHTNQYMPDRAGTDCGHFAGTNLSSRSYNSTADNTCTEQHADEDEDCGGTNVCYEDLTVPELLAHALYGNWRRVMGCVRAVQHDRLRSFLVAKRMTHDGDAGSLGEVNCYTFHRADHARLVCGAAAPCKRNYFLSVIPSSLRAHHTESVLRRAHDDLCEDTRHNDTRCIDGDVSGSRLPPRVMLPVVASTAATTANRTERHIRLYLDSYVPFAPAVHSAHRDDAIRSRYGSLTYTGSSDRVVVHTVTDCHLLMRRLINYLQSIHRISRATGSCARTQESRATNVHASTRVPETVKRQVTKNDSTNGPVRLTEELLLRTLARLLAQGNECVIQLRHSDRHGLALALLTASTLNHVRLDASLVSALLATTIPMPHVLASESALQAAVQGLNLVGRWSTVIRMYSDYQRYKRSCNIDTSNTNNNLVTTSSGCDDNSSDKDSRRIHCGEQTLFPSVHTYTNRTRRGNVTDTRHSSSGTASSISALYHTSHRMMRTTTPLMRKSGDVDACAPTRALLNAFAQAAYDGPRGVAARYIRRLWRESYPLWTEQQREDRGATTAAARRPALPPCLPELVMELLNKDVCGVCTALRAHTSHQNGIHNHNSNNVPVRHRHHTKTKVNSPTLTATAIAHNKRDRYIYTPLDHSVSSAAISVSNKRDGKCGDSERCRRAIIGAAFSLLQDEALLRAAVRACGLRKVSASDVDAHGMQRLLSVLPWPEALAALQQRRVLGFTVDEHTVVWCMLRLLPATTATATAVTHDNSNTEADTMTAVCANDTDTNAATLIAAARSFAELRPYSALLNTVAVFIEALLVSDGGGCMQALLCYDSLADQHSSAMMHPRHLLRPLAVMLRRLVECDRVVAALLLHSDTCDALCDDDGGERAPTAAAADDAEQSITTVWTDSQESARDTSENTAEFVRLTQRKTQKAHGAQFASDFRTSTQEEGKASETVEEAGSHALYMASAMHHAARGLYNRLQRRPDVAPILQHHRPRLSRALAGADALSGLFLAGHLHHILARRLQLPVAATLMSRLLSLACKHSADSASAMYFFAGLRQPTRRERVMLLGVLRTIRYDDLCEEAKDGCAVTPSCGVALATLLLTHASLFFAGYPEQVVAFAGASSVQAACVQSSRLFELHDSARIAQGELTRDDEWQRCELCCSASVHDANSGSTVNKVSERAKHDVHLAATVSEADSATNSGEGMAWTGDCDRMTHLIVKEVAEVTSAWDWDACARALVLLVKAGYRVPTILPSLAQSERCGSENANNDLSKARSHVRACAVAMVVLQRQKQCLHPALRM